MLPNIFDTYRDQNQLVSTIPAS